MTTGIIIAAIVIVLAVVAAIGFRIVRPGSRTGSLRRRFGPEYERAVERHNGDTAAAREELQERLRRHGEIETRPLSWQERERYSAEWAGVQEQFVDSPADAVTAAGALLDRLVHERGYPEAESGEQIDALSVHQPRHVQTYRDVRSAATRAQKGEGSTEELRTVLVRARGLFDELVKPGPQDPDPHHGNAKSSAKSNGNGNGSKHRAGRLHLSSRSNS
ncbi:MAG: hypothetical protein QOF84_2226 [Streptomyces sp.]|jgi:hypothetical protein|nr:hypothetical protein [Streptomyces sp.]MDX6347436.1 hypothetical protein [Streptomyces sp.]